MVFCCGCNFRVLASAGLSMLPRTTVTSPSEVEAHIVDGGHFVLDTAADLIVRLVRGSVSSSR